MPARQRKAARPTPSPLRIFAANERLNQLLLSHLAPAVWTAKPPGNVRTIAAIFTHMHNVRTKWIRLTAPHLKIPAQLNRAHCTPQQARKALAESAAGCETMLAEVIAIENGKTREGNRGEGNRPQRITQFVRDGWAKPWPAGPELPTRMLCYMLAHEAHHRGQISMLAHQLGHPLPKAVTSEMWNWEKLWK
ncbi:MAG: DinB family protein [Terracidiphilus sp.]